MNFNGKFNAVYAYYVLQFCRNQVIMPVRNRQHSKSKKELKESKLAAAEKNVSEV